MATKIRHKRSSVPGKKPIVSQLESGELALNTADGKVFLLRDDNTVQDLTNRIFDKDTEIKVEDVGDSSLATITVNINNQEKLTITEAGLNIKESLDMENAKGITFRELTASGDDGITIKSPNTLPSSYTLQLPLTNGTVGQIIRTDGNGQLEFVDADLFGGNVVYVSAENGDDLNDGQSAPVKTVKRACQIASGLVYNPDGTINNKRINVKVAVGDYTEQNPIIVPDNVVIKGDGLRGCIIRPANANQDMLRVRNACYFGEFTFRDGVDVNFVPTVQFDYAVAFDDPLDNSVSRVGYVNLPSTRPTITTSPYVQNCSILSFLGGNGAKIDGSKVESPNVPINSIEAENPVIGSIPEQGKSMVSNAFTMLSFGGTGWRLTNDAYAQIVSCFQIFMLNGVYCQSGGYCSITNSATNFGLYALRSSGFSPKAFTFDRAFASATGISEGKQTLTIVGINREQPVEEFVIKFRDPEYKIAYDLLKLNKQSIADELIVWIDAQIAAASPSIWTSFQYNESKCKRDVEYIVDALAYDVMFDSNYRSINAGLSYYRGNAIDVVNDQKPQTVAALNELKERIFADVLGSSGTAATRASNLIDEIIDIINNGTSAANAYSYPDPVGYDSGYNEARRLLLSNKTFIQDEIIAWIAVQVSSGNDPFTIGFSYNSTKCRRDVGFIIDALIYDLTYGGNLETYNAAVAYFVGTSSQLGVGQKEETLAAYAYLEDILGDILQGITISKSPTNTGTQDVSGTPGSLAAAEFAQDRIREIYDTIDSDGNILPARITPDLSWVSAPLQESGNELLQSANQVSQNVIAWINRQIQENLWYNFVYDETFCRRDSVLIVDAVAQDTWDTGNRYSRSAGLAYYRQNLRDSTEITISGQELQTIAAIERLSQIAAGYISDLDSDVRAFVDSRFDIVKTIINDVNDLPDPIEVSSEGDITNQFKLAPTEVPFDAAVSVNATTNIFTIVGHGFSNGQKLIYDPNGNNVIKGLDAEQNYYVKIINVDEFTLTFDDSLQFDVNIIQASTGTHKFLTNIQEFFVEEILSSHSTYQTLILESDTENLNFVPGRAITGSTGGSNNSAIVYSWEPQERRLVVSIELVVVGTSTQRVQFSAISVINSDHSPSPITNIGVNEVAARTGLTTATLSITGTVDGATLTNLAALPEKQIWFHRPSIVNSSSHTWEYAGSGTDYNALPQNGGNTRAEFEQYEELPGRVYSSGTNELGDFKVGDFITAFNRTGNITFRNKVQVDELDALRLTLSDIAIEEISANVNLGDDEIGGPSNGRLSTQLAVRSFISNRLGGFVDKSVSTAAVPGAIVQLNTNGQLNPDLIPATRQFTSTNTPGYLSRLLQVDEIPAVDLKAGDIATEEYEQVEIFFDNPVTANDGDTILLGGYEAYVKGNYSASTNMLVTSTELVFPVTPDSSLFGIGTVFINNVDTGATITDSGLVSQITDNYFLKSSNTSQYLLLESDETYTFTHTSLTFVSRSSNVATITTPNNHNLNPGNNVQVLCNEDTTFNVNGLVIATPTPTTFTIANTGSNTGTTAATGTVRTIVTSADGNAQGAVTETRYGVLSNVDNANITSGSGYNPTLGSTVYPLIPMLTLTGSGTGAVADITVTAGSVTDVDLRRGGTGYAIGDLLTIDSTDFTDSSGDPSTGTGFIIEVSAIENRAYVNILGGELFVASASSIDFVEDNTAITSKFTLSQDEFISRNFLAGSSGAGGDVDYITYRINIPNHGWGNGDPVTYNTLGNVAIGGLLNNDVYYVKVINSSTIELYEDYSLLNLVEFLSTPANNNHNLTRYNINLTDNSLIVLNHGLTTGDAIRIEIVDPNDSAGIELFSVTGTPIPSGSRFFIGSRTTNSFTLHDLRSDALASANGLVTNAKNIDSAGQGDIDVIPNNTQVRAVINTSSRIKGNWNSLAVTNIDASNIISGTVSPSRLGASGIPNSETFLRGDSSYSVVVQTIKKANTVDNPITLTGSNIAGEFYGDPVNIGISNVDRVPLGTYSTLGVARFLQSQFDVDVSGSGQVYIKDGVIDAGTLDALDSSYFLNPANLTSPVPVTRGGTNLTTYVTGDILYASSTGTLNTIRIGRNNSFLKSNGSIPEWGTALDLSEGLDVGSAKLTSQSIGTGQVYNSNVTTLELGGAAQNVKIGSSTNVRNITSFLSSFDSTASQSVVVNFTNFTYNTNGSVANGDREIPMASTTNILAGMIVTGSGSIPANTVVNGVTPEYIYLSVPTTGTIITGTTLTFTYTPYTAGIRAGDTINISGTSVSNLDGSWPVIGATENATSFTVQTDANVTISPVSGIPGGTSVTKDNTIVFKNRRAIFGSAEGSNSPVNATLRGEDAIGTNVAGGNFIIQPGLGTGNGVGGQFIVKTGTTATSGDIKQTSITRLTIDNNGDATFTGDVNAQDVLPLSDDTGVVGNAAKTWNNGQFTNLTIDSILSVRNAIDLEDSDVIQFGNSDDVKIFYNGSTNYLNVELETSSTGLIISDNGTPRVTVDRSTGDTTFAGGVTITGNLTINGTTTTVNSTDLSVDDINITLGATATPSDATANGGGITLKGTSDKTINWIDATDAWTFSEHIDIASSKAYYINNASVLNSTTLGSGVVNSSLQSVGTIGTGIWQGTIISPTYGGTGVDNGNKTITLGGNFTHSGAHTLTLTTTANTSITLPTSGTLAVTGNGLNQFASTTSLQLAGVISDETGSGALVFGTSPTFTTSLIAGSATMALLNTTATTVNAFGAATTIDIGAASGTTSINNNVDIDLDLNIDGGDLTTNQTTFNLINTNATTVNFAGASTALTIGATTGTATIRNSNVVLSGDLEVRGGDLTTNQTTFNLINTNATTVNFAGSASNITIGAVTSTTTISDNLTVNGNITITSGGTLTLDSINNTPIGNVTPNTGAFTTLTSNGLTTFTNNTASSAKTNGAVVITGGLGVGGAVYATSFNGSINASNIDSGTLPDARIQSTGVTQHQANITGTGALNSGSITSGFGNINIGSSIFTGNGSGLTDLDASNLSTGTVGGARLGGNQSMAGVKTFTDVTESNAYTNGAVILSGGLGVAKNIRTNGTIYGNGSGITDINATNISTGTINDGRLPTTQTGKTFSSDITVNSHKVGRGGGNSATNLAIAGGQLISTGTDNMIIGVGAGAGIVTGTDNTALGNSALAALTSATHNTAVGNDSQAQRTSTGNYNTSVGAQSMANSTAGSSNAAFGYQALELTTGDQNVGIGTLAGDSLTTGSNNIIIGYNAQPSAVNVSNELTLGNSSITSVRIPGVSLTVNTTTLNFAGATGFAGVGTSLTALNATQLTTGTIPDARIVATSITQHQSSITGTGALNSGSITSGFGSIDIGADNLTATGAVSLGATSFNDQNITNVGDIAVDSISADATEITSASLWRFTNATEATATNNAAIEFDGGIGVAKNIHLGGTITGNGSGLSSLNASNISTGTVANARLSGSYSNVTGVGALTAGSIASGFGNINIGTNTFTGNGSGLTNVNADTLDSIDSASFVRSDAADTITGLITTSRSGEQMQFADTSVSGSPFVGFYQTSTRRGYIQLLNGGTMRIASDQHGSQLDIGNGTNGLTFTDGTTWTVWHSGNDGSGSGLDADTLDGVDSGSFLRSDANDSFSGTLSGTGSINITGTVTATSFTGSGSGLTGVTADNANTLDSLDSSQFLRSDVADQKTSGTLTFNDNVLLTLGTGNDFELFHDGTNNYIDLNLGDLFVRDTSTTRFTFARTTGNFTATGEVTAYSDKKLKDNVTVIANPITKILSIRGVNFTRNDLEDKDRVYMGVIAQEIEQYIPEVVTTTDEGIKTVNYGSMAGLFIEAIKEQQQQLNKQQEQIDQLLEIIKELKKK